MTTLLAVMTCRSCSSTLLRHWPYFLNQQADHNVIIVTEDTECRTPEGVERIAVGSDSYIDQDKLPRRMVDTIERLLFRADWDVLILAEYDTLIFTAIDVEGLRDIASHRAGTFHKDYSFWHNPWVLSRDCAWDFTDAGKSVIKDGKCQGATASPDVFFGVVCHRLHQQIQDDLWTEFSRNSMDCEGDLDRARFAYHSGVDVIHGIKKESELEYITK